MLKTKFKLTKLLSILMLGLVFSESFAQYEITRQSINSGGETHTGGNYQVIGSVGQVDASNQLSGGSYSLNSGFWHEADAATGDLIFTDGFE